MNTSALTMVFMAAGKGSRFGGLKQLEGFGPRGESLLDYAIFDGLRTGFTRAVLVISAEHEAEFRARMVEPWLEKLKVDLVVQSVEDLPVLPLDGPGPAARTKPWGTGHAVWAARETVSGPFMVGNADDFYGRGAFESMAAFLNTADRPGTFAMQGYNLRDTLLQEGGFSRGICRVSTEGMLREITEHQEVRRDSTTGQAGIASMNFWGFTPEVFRLLEDGFLCFLRSSGHDPEREFFLPAVVQEGMARDLCRVRVLPEVKGWFGVTNPEDRGLVTDRLARLHQQGEYPEDLRN